MSFTPAEMRNKAAFENALTALIPQAVTDNVAVVGEIVNRFFPAVTPTPANTMNSGQVDALSANLVVQGSYTVASGAPGDAITLTWSVSSGNKANLSDATVLASGTLTVPWVSNAALRKFVASIPVNLEPAGQYVQATLKVHGVSAGGTYSAELLAANFNFGGLSPAPAPLYADGGWISENT